MRLLVALLLSSGALAQTVPAPETFDPIAVGTIRGYEEVGADDPFWRTDSPTEITLDGHRWTVRRTQSFYRTTVLDQDGWGRTESRVLVRFDAEAANVVVRQPDGTESLAYPCRLDLAPATDGTCGDGVRYSLDLDGRVDVGGGAVEAAVLEFADGDRTVRLASGIGEVGTGAVRLVQAIVASDTLAPRPDDFPPSQIVPTDASRFVPLAVGNELQYEIRNAVEHVVTRYAFGTPREIEGNDYYTVSTGYYQPGSGDGWIWTLDEQHIRYDTLSARAIGPDGTLFGRTWAYPGFFNTPCPFDEPISPYPYTGQPVVFCSIGEGGEVGSVSVRSGSGTITQQTGVEVTSPDYRTFVSVSIADPPFSPTFGLEIGYLPEYTERHVPAIEGLRFARLRQPDGTYHEIGSTYPVDSESSPTRSTLTLRVGPNPTDGPVSVHLGGVTEAGTVEVFDALGRRVTRVETAGGPVTLDAGAWAPGVYVVRATVGGETRTTTVVRR